MEGVLNFYIKGIFIKYSKIKLRVSGIKLVSSGLMMELLSSKFHRGICQHRQRSSPHSFFFNDFCKKSFNLHSCSNLLFRHNIFLIKKKSFKNNAWLLIISDLSNMNREENARITWNSYTLKIWYRSSSFLLFPFSSSYFSSYVHP